MAHLRRAADRMFLVPLGSPTEADRQPPPKEFARGPVERPSPMRSSLQKGKGPSTGNACTACSCCYLRWKCHSQTQYYEQDQNSRRKYPTLREQTLAAGNVALNLFEQGSPTRHRLC